MKPKKIKGRCACGSCTYVIDDDAGIDVANCHCATCRKSTGGTYVTWATVPLDKFHWIGTKPKQFKSSRHSNRYFCGSCGAQLALFTTKSPRTIDVTVSTFTNSDRYPPSRNIWTSTKLVWVQLEKKLSTEPRETIKQSDT